MDNVWTNLGNRLETAWKRPTRPNSKRPKDGEIIDEEKSVRWNREEVVRRQKAWDAECSRLKKAQNAEIEHISEAIELQIQEDIKAETKRSISKKAATILWQKAYDRGHAYGFADIYCAIEDSYNSVVNGVTPASTTVEAYVPTLYSLIVPESVTLGGNAGSGEKTATLPVMVKGDIGLSQEVNVSTTPPTMKSNKAADVLASVETPKAVWNRDDTLASITSTYTVKANLTPGDWSGTVSFVCSVSEN